MITFTKKYKIHRLVYYERFQHINNAIARENYLKHFTREEKIPLIETIDPTWEDLASEFFPQPHPKPLTAEIFSSFRERKAPAFCIFRYGLTISNRL